VSRNTPPVSAKNNSMIAAATPEDPEAVRTALLLWQQLHGQ
jgi:hypothetical protein